ncbi:MAG: 4-hydroxybenzoate polyprenyltransferase [Proteobacteria bacterium]|jgi:4-hydroxybenzoate polyprenyltransferase|uniref:4-hydroxybenzoate octaprenyltransferase n=1 Tax=Candidatus Fonsibacter lacus TaxID=2576439 RepID=A0A966HQ21_9PROT|nr:4-hydroxybenzoate polyprenyltransferase [Candidatus Fonsibacter lacus]NBQ00165.1 4-hydroxybenzoate polyprenyltransferase [Pseudomonadota bacterium]NBY89792.1 4-hydroxybenzoate polyprenyltransferase [Candidatus Fonsibacter lacus]NCU47022.1 4-hydroxybenzoate polyprenyltransferase [Candidatus Fonsibacter lacus]NCU50653.1 4-hydroxybenzoate polyprenyltransferase [Candidatus Fonsibacter lacus]
MRQFANLLRLNKPIGIFLLFWPCAWSLAMTQWFIINNYLFIKYLILFFIGSIIMRSAGCVYNDIVDKNVDIKVQRTKKRLIASGKITIKTAWLVILLLLIPAFIILFQFNNFSKILGLSSGLLIITYPFMKRITFWPQLFLGFTFNWGVLLGWSVFFENLTIETIVLYMAAIFWTLGYDTIYALQDRRDDLKIKIKSTAIKFGSDIKNFLFFCYISSITFLIALGFLTNRSLVYFILLVIAALHLAYQVLMIKKIKSNNKDKLQIVFNSNNSFGILIFLIFFLEIYNA